MLDLGTGCLVQEGFQKVSIQVLASFGLLEFPYSSFTAHSSLPSLLSAQAADHRAPQTFGTLNCFQLHLRQPSFASLLAHPYVHLVPIPPTWPRTCLLMQICCGWAHTNNICKYHWVIFYNKLPQCFFRSPNRCAQSIL